MEKLEADTKKYIASILTSSPFVVTMRELQRDYRNMIGEDIPFYKLGYRCLEEFLRSITDTVIVNGSGPMAQVRPVISEKSAHVNKLVTHQKTATPRRQGLVQKRKDYCPRKSLPPIQVNRIYYPSVNKSSSTPKPSVNNSSNLPTPLVKKSSNTNISEPTTPHNNNVQPTADSKVQIDNSFTKNSDEGFVSKENISPSSSGSVGKVGRGKLDLTHKSLDRQKVKRPELNSAPVKNQSAEKKFTNVETNFENSRFGVDPASLEDLEKNVPLHIKNRLRELIGSCPEGIWCGDLPDKYRLMFGKSLNFRELGFVNLIDLCIYLPSIFHYVRPSTGDFKLYDYSKPLPDCAERTFTVASYASSIRRSHTDLEMNQALPYIDWQDVNTFLPDGVFKHGEEIPRAFLPHDVKEGDEIEVQVSEIFDISKFWVYLTDSSLNELMDNMQVFYRQHGQEYLLPQHLIKEGLYCVQVIFGEYHRALIVDIMPDVPLTVRVVFIDYGTMTRVSSKGICFLHDDFAQLPAQAIRCRLANVCPVEEGVPWSREASKAFRRLVANRKISAKINSICWDEQFFEAYLADVTDGNNIFFINDKLVEDGHAQYLTKERKKPFLDPLYKQIVKHMHLFPTFLELEHGLAPSTGEMDILHDNNVPINFCYPQYFYMEFTGEKEIIRAAEDFHESHCLRNRRKVPTQYYDLEKRKVLEPDLSVYGELEMEIREFLNGPGNEFNMDSDEEEFEDADEDCILIQENCNNSSNGSILEEKMKVLSMQQEDTANIMENLLMTEDIMNDIKHICNIKKEKGYPETALNLLECQTDSLKDKDAKRENEREIWKRDLGDISETKECEKSEILLDDLIKTETDDINDDAFLFDHPLSKMSFDRNGSAEDENSRPNTPESELSAKSHKSFDLVEPDVHLQVNGISEIADDMINFEVSLKEPLEIDDVNLKVSNGSSTNPFLEDMKSNVNVSNKEIPTLNPNNPFLSYLRRNSSDLNVSESSDESSSTIYKYHREENLQHSWNNFDDLTAETIKLLGKELRSGSNSSNSLKLSDDKQNLSISTQTSDEQSKPYGPPHNPPPYVCPQAPPMYPNWAASCNNPYYHVRSRYYPSYSYEPQFPQMPQYRPQVPPGFGPPPGFAPLGAQRTDPIANYQYQMQRFQPHPNYYHGTNYPSIAPGPNAMVPCAPNSYRNALPEAIPNIQVNALSRTTSASSVSVSVVSEGKDFYEAYNEQLKMKISEGRK